MRSKDQKKFIKFCEDNGGRLHKLGTKKYEFTCLCPFHEERTASFTFNKSTLRFYCFGCAAGGRGVDDLLRNPVKGKSPTTQNDGKEER